MPSATVKKPMSSFTKFIFFMIIIFGIMGALFTVYTLNNPDAINYISNINPSTILYVFVMACVYSILLSFVLGILSYFLFDINGSSMLFLFLHIFLLLVCSPYFLIVVIWGTYTFLTTKSLSSGSSSSLKLDEKKGWFGKMNLGMYNLKNKIKDAEEERLSSLVNISNKSSSNKSTLFGGGEEDSNSNSLQKFGNILLTVDGKMISLWSILLYIYKLQNLILDSPPAIIYNKIMHP